MSINVMKFIFCLFVFIFSLEQSQLTTDNRVRSNYACDRGVCRKCCSINWTQISLNQFWLLKVGWNFTNPPSPSRESWVERWTVVEESIEGNPVSEMLKIVLQLFDIIRFLTYSFLKSLHTVNWVCVENMLCKLFQLV